MASSESGGEGRHGPVPRDPRLLLLHPDDNVVVARQPVAAGEVLELDGARVDLPAPLRLGHKLARRDIAVGEAVTKYGFQIGYASVAIFAGEHVHLHNVRSGYTASVALMELAGTDGPGPYDAGGRNA